MDWKRQIYFNVVQCLTLTIVDYDHKCHSNMKLTTTQNKRPINPRGGHDDARYEHMFVDIVPCDDLYFNDTLTCSQILPIPLVDDCQYDYITKLRKRKRKPLHLQRVKNSSNFFFLAQFSHCGYKKKIAKKLKIFVIESKFKSFLLKMEKNFQISKPQNYY